MYKDKNGNVYKTADEAVWPGCNPPCCECENKIICHDDEAMARKMGLEEVDVLKPNEHIASTNAIVIVDDNGNVTGWWDDNTPMCLVHGGAEESAEEGKE